MKWLDSGVGCCPKTVGRLIAIAIAGAMLLASPAERQERRAPTVAPKGVRPAAPPQLPEGLEKEATDCEASVRGALHNLEDLARIAAAIPKAERILEIRTTYQGATWWQTLDARQDLADLRRISTMPAEERAGLAAARANVSVAAKDLQDPGKSKQAIDTLLKAARTESQILGEEHRWHANDLYRIGRAYCSQSRYPEAETALQRALEIHRKTLGEEHPDCAADLRAIAEVYSSTNRYDQAETLYRQALEIDRKAQGETPDYAADLDGLASLYVATAHNEQAETLYKQALEIEKRTAGEHDTLYATSLCNLGDLYRYMGRYTQAETLYKQSMAIRKGLGDEHPDYARSLDRLGALYDSMGRYPEAGRLYKQAIEIRKKALGEQHPDYARSLNNLAVLYKETGRYKESEPLYLEARAIRKKVFGEQNRTYASSLDDLAQLYEAEGRYKDSETLFLQALAIRKKVLGEEHPAYAANLDNLSSLYKAMARYPEAETSCRRALEIRKTTVGDHNPAYARNVIDLAQLYTTMGRYEPAEALYRQGLEIQKKAPGEENSDYATYVDGLASLYVAMGRNEQAEALYRQALEIEKKTVGEQHPNYATSLCNLGDLYRLMARYAQAEPLYKESLAIRKEDLGEEHPDYARSLDRLAALYDSMGRYPEAEPLYKQALAIRKKALGEQHPDYARSLNNLAVLYKEMKRYKESEPLYLDALAIRKKVFGEHHRTYASSLDDLAQLYTSMKRYQEAEPLYRQALAIRKETLGEQHPAYAANLDNLALLYKLMGRYPEAEALSRQALEIRKRTVGEYHPVYTRNLRHLAAILALTNRPQEASQLLLESAQLQWVHLTENFPTMSDRQKRQFLDRSRFVQSEELSSMVFQGNGADPRDGLRGVLLSKELLFEVARQESGALTVAVAEGSPAWQKQWREREQLRHQYAALVLQSMSDTASQPSDRKSDDSANEHSIPAQIGRLAARIDQLDEQLRRGNPAYAATARVRQISLEDVSRALRSDEALIEYVLYQPYDFATAKSGSAHYGAFLLRGGSGEVTAVDLGEATVIDSAVTRLRAEMRTFINKSKVSTASEAQTRRSGARVDEKSSEVRSLIWQPLEAHLRGVKRAYLAPDGQLSMIPFEALAQKQDSGVWKYLTEEREIVYVATGRDLARLAVRAAPDDQYKRTAVLIGNPDFRAEPAVLARVVAGLTVSASATTTQVLPVSTPQDGTLGVTGGDDAPRLQIPRDWVQVDVLGTLIKQAESQLKRLGWSVTTLTGTSAMEEAAEGVQSPRILQFATHGYILDHASDDPQGWDNPLLRSMLIMAGADHPEQAGAVFYRVGNGILTEKEARARGLSEQQLQAGRVELREGVLTAYQVTGMRLSGTRVVNLTACETGLGEVTPDGVAGFRQAFLLAGARSMTMSMWEVPADETTRQIGDFYDRWLGVKPGERPNVRYEAFHAAQLAALARARQTYGTAHPFYWAGTVFVGDPGDLPSVPASRFEGNKKLANGLNFPRAGTTEK